MHAWRRSLLCLSFLSAGLLLGGTVAHSWRQAQPPSPEELPPRTWEATVYLPLNDNAGRPFADKDWRAALEILVKRFGGATLGPRREGYWLDKGQRLQREPIQLAVVSFERKRLTEFRKTVREVGKRLGQESMYVRFEEPRVELLAVAGKDP